MSAEGGQLVDQSSQTASTFPLDLKESSFTHYMSFLLHTKGSVSRKRTFLSKKIPTFLLNTLVPSLKNFCVRPFIYETPVKHQHYKACMGKKRYFFPSKESPSQKSYVIPRLSYVYIYCGCLYKPFFFNCLSCFNEE